MYNGNKNLVGHTRLNFEELCFEEFCWPFSNWHRKNDILINLSRLSVEIKSKLLNFIHTGKIYLHKKCLQIFFSNFFSSCYIFRYVPTSVWGKSGHVQSALLSLAGRFGRTPVNRSTRRIVLAKDGSTISYDFFKSLSNNQVWNYFQSSRFNLSNSWCKLKFLRQNTVLQIIWICNLTTSQNLFVRNVSPRWSILLHNVVKKIIYCDVITYMYFCLIFFGLWTKFKYKSQIT